MLLRYQPHVSLLPQDSPFSTTATQTRGRGRTHFPVGVWAQPHTLPPGDLTWEVLANPPLPGADDSPAHGRGLELDGL